MLLVLRHAQKKIIWQCRSRVSRIAEENSEPCQISKIERFSKIVTYASELRSLSLLLLFIFVICWTIVIFALTCETFWETFELVSFWLGIWKATTLEEKYLPNGYFLDIYRASAESLISETLVNRCFLQKIMKSATIIRKILTPTHFLKKVSPQSKWYLVLRPRQKSMQGYSEVY